MHPLPKALQSYDWLNIIENNVTQALLEDLGQVLNQKPDTNCDVTALLLNENKQITANLICREEAILCGQDWFERSFKLLDPLIEIQWQLADGDNVQSNQIIATLHGKGRSILTAERTAMNFLQTLSATATQTHEMKKMIQKSQCQLLDTRKTIPQLRMAQKYAVHCGGGVNHRMGLYDRFLIKENHIMACGSIAIAVQQAREINQNQESQRLIEIEVESLSELDQALNAGVDIIMLDNFSPQQCTQAVAYREQFYKTQLNVNSRTTYLEASGNINSNTLPDYASSGIDFISTGAITKNIRAIDLSLRIQS